VKVIASGRLTQTAARYGEHAPAATVCCNACRTCLTANLIGVATAALAGAGFALRNALRRA
jgi:hypothetical protein